jgi:hypothetical protein
MCRAPVGSIFFRMLLLLALPLSAWAQDQPDRPVHGLWVWKTPSVLAAPHADEALRDFCRSEHINEVYVAFTAVVKAGPATENQLAALIRTLHKSGIHVEALLSSTDADEPGPHREKLLDHVREVIAFNQSHPNASFEGVHLDIEPQQRPENKGPGNLNFLPGLLDAYRAAHRLAEPAHLTINADIQKKLLEGNLDQRRSLLLSLPQFTLMLYELSNPGDGQSTEQKEEKLRKESTRFIEMAYQGLTDQKLAKIAIGLRIPDYGPLMPQMLKTLDETFRANPHYLGWAWHQYAQ